jgi:hypothetical protein
MQSSIQFLMAGPLIVTHLTSVLINASAETPEELTLRSRHWRKRPRSLSAA